MMTTAVARRHDDVGVSAHGADTKAKMESMSLSQRRWADEEGVIDVAQSAVPVGW